MKTTKEQKTQLVATLLAAAMIHLSAKSENEGYPINLAESIMLRCTDSEDRIADIMLVHFGLRTEMLAVLNDRHYRGFIDRAVKLELIAFYSNYESKVEV